MRILIVNHLLDPVSGGGTAERSFQIARFLANVGIDCTVLTLDIGISDERRLGLGRAKLVTVPCVNERFFVPWLSSAQASRLVYGADVVQLSGHWTLLNAMIFHACRKQGKPYLFCPAGALKPFGRSLWMKRLYETLVGRRIVKSAAMCVAITEAERADFTKHGVSSELISIIPNGIDPQQYVLDDPVLATTAFRNAIGLGSAPFLLFLGRLNEIKGPDLLLEAFIEIAGRFPDLHLVLAGPDGGMRESLGSRVRACGLASRVHFTGYVGGVVKTAALRAATLLAIPSRREAMSIVVLEAGACECPVLFTNACGLANFADASAGTMVSPEVLQLAEGLNLLLGDSAGLARSARRLSDMVAKDYLWQVQAARYIALFNTLLRTRVP